MTLQWWIVTSYQYEVCGRSHKFTAQHIPQFFPQECGQCQQINEFTTWKGNYSFCGINCIFKLNVMQKKNSKPPPPTLCVNFYPYATFSYNSIHFLVCVCVYERLVTTASTFWCECVCMKCNTCSCHVIFTFFVFSFCLLPLLGIRNWMLICC